MAEGGRSPGPLRAGDRDREAIVALLGEHHLAGRLTVDELEERVARAHRAVTLLELADLHDDLPELAPQIRTPARRRSRTPRSPGLLPFVERADLAVAPREALVEALTSIAPPLSAHGYRLVERTSERLVFVRRRRPGWTIAVAIFLFPFGLIALGHRTREEINVHFDAAPGGGTGVVAHGEAPLAVRRAFARLQD